jgi:outer membrane protein assembly factor BamB
VDPLEAAVAIRTSIRGLGVVAAALLLAGCPTAEAVGDRTNPEMPSWYSRPSGAMHVVVHRALTATARQVGEEYERGRAEIDPRRNRVFVGSADHGLYALRASDGSTIWRYETLGVVQSEPYYDEELDTVYFGSHDGALYAVRAQDGSRVFRFAAGSEVSKKPVRIGETLFFANASDYLFAVDRRTGKPLWQVHRTSALGMEVSGYAGPSVDPQAGVVYMAYSDGHVVAYDARDGSEKWTPVDLSAEAEQTAGEAPRYLDVDTTPVLDDHAQGKVVYVAAYAGSVVALDAATGTRVWASEKTLGVTDLVLYKDPPHRPNPDGPDKNGPPVPGFKVLLASSATTGLWGLDPANGRVLWRNPVPDGGITAPAPISGAILVGTTRYGLFLLSPRNGKVIDGIDMGGGFAQTPSAYGNHAFAMTNSGVLLGLVIEPPIWRPRS